VQGFAKPRAAPDAGRRHPVGGQSQSGRPSGSA
jgi:hypothetical protein